MRSKARLCHTDRRRYVQFHILSVLPAGRSTWVGLRYALFAKGILSSPAKIPPLTAGPGAAAASLKYLSGRDGANCLAGSLVARLGLDWRLPTTLWASVRFLSRRSG
jgi:hypothetical protein